MERLAGLLGVFVFIGIAYAFSQNRKAVPWKVVLNGLILQFVFALIVLKTTLGQQFFALVGTLVQKLYDFSNAGTDFVFGSLNQNMGTPWGFIFAVKVLPTIIFFASLMNVLYYLGIMQKVIGLIARFMVTVLGTSGAETLVAAANIFMGQTEAPLLIRPYLEVLTASEIMVMMTAGFATIAAGVMALYAFLLHDLFPSAAGHLLAASIMSAPAALLMAKVLVPETGEPVTRGSLKIDLPRTESNLIEAAGNGASTGLTLALNVGAMLIAFIALVAMLNGFIHFLGGLFHHPELSLEMILGTAFAPFAFLMGVAPSECIQVGALVGKSLVINEFVAYTDLINLLKASKISGRACMLSVYALCGFSNLSSIGIQVGGIGALAPGRKHDLARLGVLALLGATLANFQTAAIAGVLADDTMTQIVAPAATVPPPPPAPIVASPTPGTPTPASPTP